MLYRHLDQESSCELCGHPVEDCFHAVISCPHARALRHELRSQMVLPDEADLIYTGPDWLLLVLDRYDNDTISNFLMLIWRCWSVRNSVLQAGEQISIAGSVTFLTRYMQALFQIRQQPQAEDIRGKQNAAGASKAHVPVSTSREEKKWVAPEGEVLKINVDGAFINLSGEAAVGVVIRDCKGEPLLSACRWLRHCRDAEEAEAQACLEGVRLAERWREKILILESDCSTVIDKLAALGIDRSPVAPII